ATMISRFGRKQFPLKGVRFDTSTQRLDSVDKFIDVLKSLMDRGVAEICHLVNGAQFLKHLGADIGGENFAATGFKFMNNVIHDLFQSQQTSRAFLKSLRDAAGKFPPIKRLMRAIAFHDAQIRSLDFFIGGKPIYTAE